MDRVYESALPLKVSAAQAFAWHERPGAFERLAPPWESLRVVARSGGIRDGGRLKFEFRTGPIWQTWEAEHFGYQAGVRFADRAVRSPFAFWEHEHRFSPNGDAACVLHDQVRYRLPLAPFSNIAPRFLVEDKIEAMFAWRRTITKRDVELHAAAGLAPQRVLVSGARGLVGRQLSAFLTTGGHTVVPLLRGDRPDGRGVIWNPELGFHPQEEERLEGLDAVVHLAGEPVLGLWTQEKKRQIRESRIAGTRLLCEALARRKRKPSVLVCASAIGIYGDRADEELTEESLGGRGFLAEVARGWEDATAPARQAGIRVVNLRIGIVLTPQGGALAGMLPAFSLGLGGRLGSGRQWMSWISVEDVVGLIHHALRDATLQGPMNATAPAPTSNAEFTRVLASVLRRPVGPAAPEVLLQSLGGALAQEMLLASTRVLPAAAQRHGYQFLHPTLEGCFRSLLGRVSH